MFPRRSAVSKVAIIILLFVVCTWVWTIGPNSPDLRVLNGVDNNGASIVRRQSVSEPVQSPENMHHHNNQSLNAMRNNMTVLKANQSDLHEIIRHVNQSISVKQSSVHQANPHPFKYLINTVNICKNKDVFLIVYVHTAPDHYKRRMVIRQTWSNQKYYPDTVVRVVFVMGNIPDKTQAQSALQFESEQYNDIVQEDFLDSYKNLTYKGVAGLKWVSNYCPHATFTLKSDDDIFVNMFTLLRHLKSLHKLDIYNTGLIMCLVWNSMKVMRTGKWKISEADYKDEYYPTYCSGSAFTMSTDVAIALHNVSYDVPFFWVDDFYITGLLPLKLGLKHKQFMSTYVLDGRKLEERFNGPQWFTYIFSHVHNLNKIQFVWDRLVQLNSGERAPSIKYALPGQLPNEAELRKKEEEEIKKKKVPTATLR